MDNRRPHSRGKRVGTGSAGVGKGRKTGVGPVGSGGRTGAGSGNRDGIGDLIGSAAGSAVTSGLLGLLLGGGSSGGSSSKKSGFSWKKLLVIAVVIILLIVIFKQCGGLSGIFGNPETGELSDYSEIADDVNASYKKPDYSVSKLAREKYYTPATGDTVTVMVYMCGTDLESKYGMATADLKEMLKAKSSDNVNVIVETGGCKQWKTSGLSNTCNQILRVQDGKLKMVKKDAGNASMTDPANLADFIKFCKTNYPADRNILIFWDHGGGSLSGYGYDERHTSSSSMTLTKINEALKKGGCKFDFIGFDACLMATMETALVCNGYADYLIASEETEPGTGWYYTNWLSLLAENTAIPTVDLSKQLIDDFVNASCSASTSAKVTLSAVDLAELEGTVPASFSAFAEATGKLIADDQYKTVSSARANTRQFSSGIDQIDLIDLAQQMDTAASKDLAKALKGCVKYNRTTITRSHGISIYFPYESTSKVKSAIASYNAIGDESECNECIQDYAECIRSFASLGYAGQIAGAASQTTGGSSITGDLLGSLISSFGSTTTASSPVSSLLGSFLGGSGSSSAGTGLDASSLISLFSAFSGRSMPAEYDWVDTDLIAGKARSIAADFLDPSRLTATEKGGKKVLSLTDEEWALIETAELNVFVDDGEGFIDLGLDNTFEWTDDGDLLLDFDGTWLTVNGKVCAYYLMSDTEQEDGTWTTVGRIPALLNGEYADLQVVFDKYHPDGAVVGALPGYGDTDLDVEAKGMVAIEEGDKIEFLCDYYTYKNAYDSTHTLGTPLTVPRDGLTLVNLHIAANGVSVAYRLTDIYGNHFWVPVE